MRVRAPQLAAKGAMAVGEGMWPEVPRLISVRLEGGMGWVTNTIVHYADERPSFLERVNRFFEGDQPGFVSVKDSNRPFDAWYGGNKYLRCNLAIGAFNHLDLDGLIRHLREVAPDDYDLQLMIKEPEQDRFRIININEELTPSE